MVGGFPLEGLGKRQSCNRTNTNQVFGAVFSPKKHVHHPSFSHLLRCQVQVSEQLPVSGCDRFTNAGQSHAASIPSKKLMCKRTVNEPQIRDATKILYTFCLRATNN
jgi:hypothetical protein